MDQGVWSEYSRWNEALTAQFFGGYQAELPAYIDVDSSLIEDCAKGMGLPAKGATDALVAAVRPTLGLGEGDFVLANHVLRLQRLAAKVPALLWAAGQAPDTGHRPAAGRRAPHHLGDGGREDGL